MPLTPYSIFPRQIQQPAHLGFDVAGACGLVPLLPVTFALVESLSQAPAQRSSEHVLTIPEKTVPAVWSALQGPKLLTSGELLKIVGAAGPNVPSPPLVLPEASTASPAGLPLLPTNAPSQ